MTITEEIKTAAEILNAAGVADAERQTLLLLMAAADIDRTAIIAHPELELTKEQSELFRSYIERRCKREPLQYIIGFWDFYGLEFAVSPGILIPRPETEILVENAIDHLRTLKQPEFAEIGVGSGCISVSILVNVPHTAAVATDISKTAIEIATSNAERHGVADRLTTVNTSVLDGVDGTFDMIVTNPPYIPDADRQAIEPEITEFEPSEALFAGDDGLDVIRFIAETAHSKLKKGGILLIEIGAGQSRSAAELFDSQYYANPSFLNDLQSIPRILKTSARH